MDESPLSERQLLEQRLESIRAEKAELTQRVQKLDADESRIVYALDTFREALTTFNVVATKAVAMTGSMTATVVKGPAPTFTVLPSSSAVAVSSPFTVSAPGGMAVEADKAFAQAALKLAGTPSRSYTLEDLIQITLGTKTGMTSREVVEAVQLASPNAKPASILSTLSRLTRKRLVSHVGRLYLLEPWQPAAAADDELLPVDQVVN